MAEGLGDGFLLLQKGRGSAGLSATEQWGSGLVSATELMGWFFGIITRQGIRCGTFTSVKDLIGAIEVFVDGWNERREPFIWAKTADQIIPHATHGHPTSTARH